MTRAQALSEPEVRRSFSSNEFSYSSWHAFTQYVLPAWHGSSPSTEPDPEAHSAEHSDRSPMASLLRLDLFTTVELRWSY